jgi:hypothetical protein
VQSVGAFEGIALVIAGAIVKWVFDMSADRARKSDEADKSLAVGERSLQEKVAELDKTSSMAIVTLTTGMEHIVTELSGIRSDMKEQRDVIFKRIDRNEDEIKQVKSLVDQVNTGLQMIDATLNNMKCAPK